MVNAMPCSSSQAWITRCSSSSSCKGHQRQICQLTFHKGDDEARQGNALTHPWLLDLDPLSHLFLPQQPARITSIPSPQQPRRIRRALIEGPSLFTQIPIPSHQFQHGRLDLDLVHQVLDLQFVRCQELVRARTLGLEKCGEGM